jgi:hypothetical protein
MPDRIPIHYLSLDQARALLRERWRDVGQKARVSAELGGRFIPAYGVEPLAVTTRQLMSADNGCAFFLQCARYLGAAPLAQEFLGDVFFHDNEEKKGLGRLRVELEDGSRANVDLMDFHANEKRALGACVLKTGENLSDFHHRLLALDGCDLKITDNTTWYRAIGRATDYYHPLLLHFVAHAVLFENFCEEEESTEAAFTDTVIRPALARIQSDYDLDPLIVRAYPADQSDDEDFYWWSHSPQVNRYLLDYAREHQLKIKPWGGQKKL